MKQEDINLEIDGNVVRVRCAHGRAMQRAMLSFRPRVLRLLTVCFLLPLRAVFRVASADYKVPDEYSGDDIKWHRAGRPFGCATRRLRIARPLLASLHIF